MISDPLLPADPPLSLAPSLYPTLLLRDDWTIRASSPQAEAELGFRQGQSLLAYLDKGEQRYHLACLRHENGCEYDPLKPIQSRALFHLQGLPPYTLLYARYLHTLKSAVLHAALFPNRLAYRRYLATEDTEAIASLRHCGWEVLLRESDAADMEQRLYRAAASLPALSPTAERPLFSLGQVLTIFFEEVLPHLYPLDSQVQRIPLPPSDWYAPLTPQRFFLLLSVLICAMDALSDSRCVRLRLTEDGAVATVTGCARLSPLLCGAADLYVLSTVTPHRPHLWALAESLLAEDGHDVQLRRPSPTTLSVELLTNTVTIPVRFHSAAAEERMLREAARELAGLLDHQ